MLPRWQFIATVLGISSRIKDAGSENTKEECMDDDIHTWLRRAHNEKKHGPPTWRKLVEAIADNIGGQDPAYAEKIAKEHPSECTAESSQAYRCMLVFTLQNRELHVKMLMMLKLQ